MMFGPGAGGGVVGEADSAVAVDDAAVDDAAVEDEGGVELSLEVQALSSVRAMSHPNASRQSRGLTEALV